MIKHYQFYEFERWKLLYFPSILFMLCCLYIDGLGQDIDFWRTWIIQLSIGGYAVLDANYPPLLLHWLRLFAVILDTCPLDLNRDLIIKIWVQLPVLLIHVYCIQSVAGLLIAQGTHPAQSSVFWLTAFNPAFLLNGPIWGQVDLLPFLFLYFAVLCAFDIRQRVWMWPWFMMALLCKFQAIVLLPLLAGLSFRSVMIHLKGISISVLIAGFIFLPFIVNGVGYQAFWNAYLGNINLYPYSTLNAANLWFLLLGESFTLDSVPLLNSDSVWLTPKLIGRFLFLILSVLVFYRAIKVKKLEDAFGLAVVLVVGFFGLCTGMHERYMFLAVPFAALLSCYSKSNLIWYVLVTALVYLNMNLVLPLSGYAVWMILSGISFGLFFILSMQKLFSVNWSRPTIQSSVFMGHYSFPYMFLLLMWLLIFGLEFNRCKISRFWPDQSAVLYFDQLKPILAKQDYGVLTANHSLENQPLCLLNACFDKGLSTHANSFLLYKIPDGFNRLSGIAGLAENSVNGCVELKIELDGKLVWQKQLNAENSFAPFDLAISQAHWLSLKVDGLGSIESDHADWADIKFDK